MTCLPIHHELIIMIISHNYLCPHMASIKTCMPVCIAQLFEKMSCPKGATTSWIPDSLGQLQGDRSTTSIETTVCVGGAYHSLIVLRRRQWRLICFGIFKTRGNRLRAVPVSSSRVCGSSRFSARVRVKNSHPETPEQVADGGGKAEGAYALAMRSLHCTAHTPSKWSNYRLLPVWRGLRSWWSSRPGAADDLWEQSRVSLLTVFGSGGGLESEIIFL